LQESACTLYKKCVTFKPSDDHPSGHHEDSWVCELSKDDAKRTNAQFVEIVESDNIAATIANATSGESELILSEAIVDFDRPRMYIPENSHVELRDIDEGRGSSDGEKGNQVTRMRRRRLTKTSGSFRTLVIRVIDSNNVQPNASVAQLQNDVFDDAVSLKTQTEACSYGKLRIQPFTGNTSSNRYISNGIVDVKMDFAVGSGSGGIDQAALRAANQQIGDLADPMFDLVMFCFPPGETNFLAFAYPSSKYSFYNNDWCGYVTTQMHEVGHNLGLAHSGQPGEGEYGDGTGAMGGSSAKDDIRKCYNPQKNYQLGWYEDKVKTIDPLDGDGYREYVLNGVADYMSNENALVVLRLKQRSSEQDYYIGYNRATGINTGTSEDRDKVTIVKKEYGAADQYGQSTKVASLSPGQSFGIRNFNGNGYVEVAFIGIRGGDAKITVNDNDAPLATAPENCQRVVVELTTDNYPQDNFWYIAEKGNWGRVVATAMPFTEGNRLYRQEVCLPMGRGGQIKYNFKILDSYGDGFCCGGGNGFYRVYNDRGRLIFSSTGSVKFDAEEHEIEIRADPNPPSPTAPPTFPPTAQPTATPQCDIYSVEVKTDRYPSDTSWEIFSLNNFDEEIVEFRSPVYNEGGKMYRQAVCLSQGHDHKIRFSDSYNDGICCGSGEGYYRVINNCGNVIIDSGMVDTSFDEKLYDIDPDNGCTKGQSPGTIAGCKDTEMRFRVKKRSKAKSCRALSRRGLCGKKIKAFDFKGRLVEEVCPESCKRC